MKFIGMSEKKTGALISYITLAAQTLSTILVTPFLINSLGKGEYGLFELVGSTVSYLSILSLGLASSYIKFYSKYEEDKDGSKIASLNGLFLTLFMVMAAICLIVGGFLIINITLVFGQGISSVDYPRARVIMSILVVDMALKFPASIFTSYVSANEKFVFQKLLALLETILVPALRIMFVVSGYKSIGLAATALCVSLFELVINSIYNVKKLKIRFIFSNLDKTLFNEIAVFTFFIFINQVYDLLGGSKVDIYIIGRIKGTEEVTVYSVADKFVKIFYSMASPIAAVFVPEINKLFSKNNDIKSINRIFLKVTKLQFAVQLLILSGFFIFGKEFIRIWMGAEYDNSYLIAVIIMTADLVALSQHVGVEIQRAMNKHKIRSLVLLLTNLGNIAFTIPLTIKMESVGAAFATAICEIFGTVLFMNWYYKKHLKLDIGGYWKNSLKTIMYIVPIVMVFVLIRENILNGSIGRLFIVAGVYSAIYIIIFYCVILNSDEKKMILKR